MPSRSFSFLSSLLNSLLSTQQPKTDEQKAAISKRLLKKEESKRKQLAALGIEYEFSGYAQKEVAAPVKAVAAKETPLKAGKGAKKEKASSAKKPAKSEEVS